MAAKLVFAPAAELDISDAYDWYEKQRPGLGEEFLSCVDAAIQRILQSPEFCAKAYKDYRRVLIRRFPYVVFYRYADNTVTVYCVFHASQNPNKWRKRLS